MVMVTILFMTIGDYFIRGYGDYFIHDHWWLLVAIGSYWWLFY
jgi:hypothetical protein